MAELAATDGQNPDEIMVENTIGKGIYDDLHHAEYHEGTGG